MTFQSFDPVWLAHLVTGTVMAGSLSGPRGGLEDGNMLDAALGQRPNYLVSTEALWQDNVIV